MDRDPEPVISRDDETAGRRDSEIAVSESSPSGSSWQFKAGPRELSRRITRARRSLLAILAGFALFAFAGWLSWPLASLCALLVVAATALFPQWRGARQQTWRPPRQSLWPNTQIKLMAEALPDPCFILDAKGAVRYANEHTFSPFGQIRPGEPISFRLRAPPLVAAINNVAAGGPPERTEFVESVPAESWYEANVAPLRLGKSAGGDDRPNFLILVLRDLTEQRRLDKMRADFVANASHELRTPLASLSGFIETLEGAAKDDPEARGKFLAVMREQAQRMSRLIGDLLSLSRIEMKVHVRPTDVVDLCAIVAHVADAMTPLARDLGVTIEKEFGAPEMPARGDRDELIQVFDNLVENAIKYGRRGKRVKISGMQSEGNGQGEWRISVRDFGPGIAAEHLPRLTERFYRADIEESRAHQGTGLGLAIVKHIIARHRAQLSIESTPGNGAEFVVRFSKADSQNEE